MLRLRVATGEGPPRETVFDTDSIVIGRSAEADLVLADRWVSRRHARLSRHGNRLVVEDLGSHNGTWVDGRKIVGATPVEVGKGIQISETEITVLAVDTEGETAVETDLSAATVLRRVEDLLPEVVGGKLRPAPGRSEIYAQQLAFLTSIQRALAAPIGLEELLELLLDRVFEYLAPDEATVFLERGGVYRAAAKRRRPGVEGFVYSTTLIREVAERQLAALVPNLTADPRFAEADSVLDLGVQSLVAAPLVDTEGTLGMIVLASRHRERRFDEHDLELLSAFASAAALRIRNFELSRAARERERLSAEVALARAIQVALLPGRLPEVEGWEIHAGNLPSRGVSGDFYEVLERATGEELVLVLADVSGKGVGASLLTATLEALAAGPVEVGEPPETICRLLNHQLFQRTDPAQYATAFFGVLDRAAGRLRYASAGHNPALVVHAAGGVEWLEATGRPLGLLADSDYSACDLVLEAGDLLLVYSDGITEASDAAGHEYGEERLASICLQEAALPLAELAAAVEKDLERHAGEHPFEDDRTLLFVRRTSAPVA